MTNSPWPTDIGWMEFDAARPPARWGLPDIVLGLLAFLIGSVVFAIPALLVTMSSEHPNGDLAIVSIAGLLGSWAATVGFLVLISRFKGQGSLRRDFGFRFSWWDPLIGLGAGLVTLILAGIISQVVAAVFNDKPGSNSDQIFGPAASNKPALVIMVLMASIGAPIVEELLFRGLVLRAVEKRLGGIIAVMGSTLVFALLHFQGGSVGSVLSLLAAIAVYGLVFALVTRWSHRLGPSICTHIFINGLSSAVMLYSVFTGTPLTA